MSANRYLVVALVRFSLLLALVVAAGAAPPSSAKNSASDPVYRIAVPLEGGYAETDERWVPLAKYLNGEIRGASVRMQPIAVEEMSKALRRGEVEFAIVPPVKVPRLLKDAPVSVLATATIPGVKEGRVSAVAGSILVLKDRADLKGLAALRGKRVIAGGANSLPGWVAPLGLLRGAGIDPDKDLADLRFASESDTVLDALNAGMIDAAVVSHATLMDGVRAGNVKPDQYRVLTATGDEALDENLLRGTTEALPLDAFLRGAEVSDAAARSVAQALYRLEAKHPAASYCAWTLPANYTSVHTALWAAGEPWNAELAPAVAPSMFSQWPLFSSLLVTLVASLAAFRQYTLMRRNKRIAEQTVHEAKQDLVATQEALTRAGHMRASLLANFRQDFRTPLTAVLEISRLLRTTSLSSAQVEYVNAIRETTHNLMSSIGNVTDFASLEAGALQTESRDFDLMDVIDTSLQNVYEQMGEHHAELSVQVDVNVPRALVGDPARIRQVLQNLLHNAMKF
nr:PhnD/SsuA/transferrin family substrate-binding protein [Bryobacterales bacterium]